MRPLKSSFPKLPFRDGLCGWCLLVGGCQLFRAWVLIKGIKERQGAILRDSLLGGWVFIFSDFHWRGAGRNFVAKTWCETPSFHPQTVPYFIYLFIYLCFQSYVTLSFHSSIIYADFWFKIILIGICSCLSAFYHTLMWMLWFKFLLPGLFFSLCVKLIIIHYHTPKQRDIIFKPRMKLNHNMHS